MLVSKAVERNINDDGWYELNEDDRYRVYVENGKVMYGVRPDAFGLLPTLPYVRFDAHSFTSACGEYELKDLMSGKLMMM